MITVSLHPTRIEGERPVLLIHGMASSAEHDWVDTGVVAALGGAGRGAVLVHLPGHRGGGTARRGELSLDDLVAALVAEIDATGQRTADVVGYSLGARLAWALAATGRVHRLVLGGLSPAEPFAMLDLNAVEAVVLGGAAPSDPMLGMIAGMLSGPGMDPASALGLAAALQAAPFDPAVGAPVVPTLVLRGTEDPMTQGLAAIASALPDAEYLEVPGDHVGALRSPEFREAAAGFLG